MAQEKIQIKVQISPHAKTILEKVCVDRDMTQIGVASRILTWFAGQDPDRQAEILGFGKPEGRETMLDLVHQMGEAVREIQEKLKELAKPVSAADKPRKTG